MLILPKNVTRTAEGGLRTKGYYKVGNKEKPLISIITVVYNSEEFLEKAINSVITQGYDNIEYILIDGGSTDKTVDIIKKYENHIDYWVSEPDEGQSDAFIKAFSVCNGEWMTWLNGDDILLANAINELVYTSLKHSTVDCFTGNVIWTTADNKIIQCRKGEAWNNFLPKLGILNVYGPTTFFKRSLYNKVEGINRNLHYKMDTDLWWQFYKANAEFKRLKEYTWALRFHKNAKTSGKFFEDSVYADQNHSFWEQTKLEQIYINNKYCINKRKYKMKVAKCFLSIFRILSFRYLSSLFCSKMNKGLKLDNMNKII